MISFILLTLCAGAVPVEEWNKTFRNGDYNWAWSVQQTTDGGYILAGWANSQESTWYGRYRFNLEAWLIKTDMNGSQQWKKKFGPGWIMSFHQSRDDGYILSGGTSDNADANSKAWLIKTDTNGNEQWNSTFGRTIYGTVNSVQQTFDGGYILAGTGYTGSYNVSDSDVWLIKVSKEPSEAARIPTPGRTEKVSGFEIVLIIITFSAVYVFGRKRR